MTSLLRSVAFTAMLSTTLFTGLVAQTNSAATSTHPACSLLTDQELDAATGLDFGPGDAFDHMGQGSFAGATCVWGGVWNADPAKSLPQVGVVLMPPGPLGSHTEFYRGRTPGAGCTRETLRGIGDFAFAEACQSSSPSMRVYVKAGRKDAFIVVDMLDKRQLSWAQPVAVALAKAIAPKARKS